MKAVPLKVSGAFHSPLMAPALDGLKRAVAAVPLVAPSTPLVANVTATPLTDTSAIRQELVAQLDHRVQWQKSVELMCARSITTFLEFGPGQVLAGLIKRTSAAARTFSLGDTKSIEASVNSLSPLRERD
jgi:[acyl-carrier-protein] S-malonyltransferase